MLSNDNAFLNTYTSEKDAKCRANPFDQRTLFARFKTQAARTSGINDIHPIILLRHAVDPKIVSLFANKMFLIS